MAENGGCGSTAWALDVHKVGVGSRDGSLELVGLLLFLGIRVKEVRLHLVEL